MSTTLFFKVDGMTCANCEGSLQVIVGSLAEVESSKASHQWSLLQVKLKPEASENIKNIQAKIIAEVKDIFAIEALDSFEDAFNEQTKTEKPRQYFNYALANGAMMLLMYLSAGLIPVLGASMLAGSVIHAGVLGLMMITGKPFYQDAWAKLKAKSSSMNTLISMSTLAAWSLSMLGVFFPAIFVGSAFAFMPIFMILGIANVGRAIRAIQEDKANTLMKSFDDMFKANQPKTALVIKDLHDLNPTQIPYQLVKPNMYVVVEEGEPLPIDGRLMSDQAMINQRILTGESFVSKKRRGEVVYAGTENTQGRIIIQATCHGKDNTILRLLNQVRQAQLHPNQSNQANTKGQQGRLQTMIQWFVPGVIALAAASGLAWVWMTGSILLGFNTFTSVLLCACPCGIGLAAPLSQAFAMYKMLHKNILVKDADKLKDLSEANTLVFDKTGTISDPSIKTIRTQAEQSTESVSKIIASLEYPFLNQHPIAKACVDAYQDRSALYQVEASRSDESRKGVLGRINGHEYMLGSKALLKKHSCQGFEAFAKEEASLIKQGLKLIYLAEDHTLKAVIGLKDDLKPGVKQSLSTLKQQGYNLVLLTGDNKKAASNLTKGLPFDQVYTDETPQGKFKRIQQLKKQGNTLAYIGDGVNDMKAATACDVTLAIQPWTDLASVAHISLKGDVRDIWPCIQLSRLTQNNINQNLIWTLAYNFISLAVASFIPLSPVIFAASMAVSSIGVLLNASRLPGILDGVATSSAKLPSSRSAPSPETSKPVVNTLNQFQQKCSQDKANKTTCCCEPTKQKIDKHAHLSL